MNRKYTDLVSIGYQRAGVYSESESERAKAHAKSLRVDGTKAVVVPKTEITHFRNSSSRNTYLLVMELPSEVTLAKRKAEREAINEKIRQGRLRHVAKGLTMEDVIFILNVKREEIELKNTEVNNE